MITEKIYNSISWVICYLIIIRWNNRIQLNILFDTLMISFDYYILSLLSFNKNASCFFLIQKSVRQYLRISNKWSCIIIIMEKTYTIKISISEAEIIPQSHNGVLLFSSFMSPAYPLSFLSLCFCPSMFAIFHWKMMLMYQAVGYITILLSLIQF